MRPISPHHGATFVFRASPTTDGHAGETDRGCCYPEPVTTPVAARSRIKPTLAVMAFLATVTTLVLGHQQGVTPMMVRNMLHASGSLGVVVFITAFALLQPIGVAAHIWVIAASLVWPKPLAFTISWLGAMLAGCVAFWFARYVGKDWVQARLPPRLYPFDEQLANHGFRTVLLMRLAFFTFGPMQLMFGVSRVSFPSFLAASAIGLTPLIAAETWLGGSLIDWLTTL